MRRKSDNPMDLSQIGLDEAEVLAWIEGEADEASDERMQRLLKAAPAELARTIVAMRRDSILLNTSEQAEAPADLVASALARAETTIEREMLVGLGEGEPIAFDRPRTRVERSPGWFLDAIFDSVVGRVAIAAILILSAGSAIYLAMGPFGPTPTLPSSTGPVAMNDAPDDDAVVSDPGDAPSEFAAADAEAETDKPAAPGPIEPIVEEAPAISIAEALDLLGDRRLMIRVHTLDASDTLVRLGAIASESTDEQRGAWALTGRVPEAVLAAVGDVSPVPIGPARTLNAEPIIADEDGVTPTHRVELPPMPPLPDPVPPVFLADVRPDEAALTALMSRLGRGAVTHIELVALDEALPEPELPALTRDAVLWWVRPVGDWAPRVRVPVVVELD